MKRNMGEINIRVNNNTIKMILIQLDKCRKERLHALKSLPGDYKLKDFRIRVNEAETMYKLMKERIESLRIDDVNVGSDE